MRKFEYHKRYKTYNSEKHAICNALIFMHEINSNTAPYSSNQNFKKVTHKYPTKYSQFKYKKPKINLEKSKVKVSNRAT